MNVRAMKHETVFSRFLLRKTDPAMRTLVIKHFLTAFIRFLMTWSSFQSEAKCFTVFGRVSVIHDVNLRVRALG